MCSRSSSSRSPGCALALPRHTCRLPWLLYVLGPPLSATAPLQVDSKNKEIEAEDHLKALIEREAVRRLSC